MSVKLGDFGKALVSQIDEIFIDEIGPVGLILCEETFDEWIGKLEAANQQPSLRHLAWYIKHLANEIDDETTRKQFTDRVYQIEALEAFRKSH